MADPTGNDFVSAVPSDPAGRHRLAHRALFRHSHGGHRNTPLTHRDRTDLPRLVDSVDLTAGSHFLLGERVSLGVGLCVPVTGPKLFDFEALANLNLNF